MKEAKSTPQFCALIADDQAPMRTIVRTILRSLGVKHIVEVSDGAQALVELEFRNTKFPTKKPATSAYDSQPKKRVNLVVCDWNMPELTGLQLLECVRRNEELKRLPFIMLTAQDSEKEIVSAIQLGVTDYITKPFPAKVLETKVMAILDRLR